MKIESPERIASGLFFWEKDKQEIRAFPVT